MNHISALCVGLLILSSVPSKADEAVKGLRAAEKAQAEGREAPPVESSIIKEAEPALLASSTGDVSTTGDCSSDIKFFCANERPGEGRLSACLTNQKNEEEKGSVTGRTLSSACKRELRSFKKDRAGNVNKDVKLATACKKDVTKLCNATSDEQGAVLGCLVENQRQLREACRKQVLRAEISSSKDYALDAMLERYCSMDAHRLCEGVTPGGGRVQYCLRSKWGQLEPYCQNELFRKEIESAGDIRLSRTLIRKCLADKGKFCNDIKPGNARVTECLEDHRTEPDFSSECKQEIERVMERRSSDFRLDSRLRELCQDDIENMCGSLLDEFIDEQGTDPRQNGTIANCLQDHKDELASPACRARVHKLTERSGQDIRMNKPLAEACKNDRERLCKGESPGQARVLRCLQDQRSALETTCRQSLFEHEQRLSASIDFQYPLKKACQGEVRKFCKDVPRGSGRVLSCLANSSSRDEFGPECAKEISKFQKRQSEDARLNFRLQRACETQVDRLCPDACPARQGSTCGGKIVQCLSNKSANITEPACKVELFNVHKAWARDYRNNAVLKRACEADADKLCKDVKNGGGRVHACLRSNKEKLSKECAEQELKLDIVQSSDIRLRPKLYRTCGEEMEVYCANVKPGKGRVFRCLESNMGRPDFSHFCLRQIQSKQERQQQYYQLNYSLKAACSSDINSLCDSGASNGTSSASAKGSVLSCLVSKHSQLEGEGCAQEVARAARTSLWNFKTGASLSSVCDMDAKKHCSKHLSKGARQGSVGHCLAEQASRPTSSMAQPCRYFVKVAAEGEDPQKMLDGNAGLSRASFLLDRVGTASTKYGITRHTSLGNHEVTLNGFAAIALSTGIAVSLVCGSVYMYRRYILSTRYTFVVKGGDL